MAHPFQSTGANASIITNSIAPLEPKARVEWIKAKKQPAARFALASKKAGCLPDMDDKLSIERMANTVLVFGVLENDTQMSPELNHSAGIETWLAMFNNPVYHFPEDIKQRAQSLLQRFQGENWGAQAPAAVDSSANSDSAEEVASPATPAATAAPAASAAPEAATAIVMYPPANHRIWGHGGIMHDILPSKYTSSSSDRSMPMMSLGGTACC